MSVHLAAKAPSDIAERIWTPKPGEGVSSASFTVSTGTATVSSNVEGESVAITITGGAAGVTQTIAASAIMANGETITQTIYVPVIASTNAQAVTGQDIAAFALRKVFGRRPVTAEAQSDALERLTDMLAMWSQQGADLGVPLPIINATVFYCADAHISAIKNNLILALVDRYGFEPSPFVIRAAVTGLGAIKNALRSREPVRAEYF